MQEMFIIVLTLIFCWFALKLIKKRTRKKFSKILYSQNDMHKLLKYFFSINASEEKRSLSQLTKHKEKSMIKAIVLDNQAYWVSNNIFYIAEAVNGNIQYKTAQPIDTNNLSKKEISKMLFILDNLRSGKKNDSGGTGN